MNVLEAHIFDILIIPKMNGFEQTQKYINIKISASGNQGRNINI